MKSSGSRVVITALTAATVLVGVGLTAVARQGPPGHDRSATDLFHGRAVAAGEVLVAFRQVPDLTALRGEIDADADDFLGAGHVWHARSRSKSVVALIAQLSAHREVLYAEPNYMVYTTREPNDPRFPELWGLRNIGQTINGTPGTPGADIGATAAWDLALGSRNTVVGIVDTGIDYSHPDLAANAWSAPASYSVTIGGQTITCAAGTHGFNAVNKSCDPFDDHFHGTHVSGTIGGAGNNGVGVVGVNWFANIMGLKFLTASGSGSTADAINAIEFAIQAKLTLGAAANVRVLSNSWAGGGFSQALLDEINRANQNDILFVAAAGNAASNNDATPTYPASYAAPNVVAVAATDNQDALASFSNYGAASVHLGAPGVKVLSTLPASTYGYFSGTSMATPHVSGAAALLLSRCTANTAALKTLLLNNVDQIPALSGRTTTGGRLNIGRAVAACGPAGNTSPMVTLTDPPDASIYGAPASITLRATAGDANGTVTQVAFYAGTALVGIDTTSPFAVTWSDAAVGNYAITAVATDNGGATTTSAAATVHVLPGPGSLPFGGSAVPIPGVVEAENFNEGGDGVGYHDTSPGNSGGKYRQTDVDIETSGDTGGGYSLGYVNAGEWLAYRVSAVATTNYTLNARVASVGAGGTFHVEVDGFDVTGPMTVPDTGGWQLWQTISSAAIPLDAGSHLMRVVIDTKGTSGWMGNVNYFRWTAPGVNGPPTVGLTAPADGANYLAPATIALSATASDPDGSIAQVSFYAGSTLLVTDTGTPYTFSWSNVPVGNYSLTAVATDNSGASTTSGAVIVHVVTPPSSTPFGGTAAPIPGLIEAENFDDGGEGIAYHDLTAVNSGGQYRQTGVDIEATADVGGGYSLGYVAVDEWLRYTVSVAAAASYTFEARVASPGTGGTFHVEVDGVNATGALAVPNTGGWQTWRSVLLGGIPLSAGTHVMRVVIDTNGPLGYFGNLNYFRWTPPGFNNAPSVQLTTPANGANYFAPASIALNANASDSDGTVTQVAFYAGTSPLGTDPTSPFTFTWNSVPVGDYSLTAVATDNAGATSTSAAVIVHVLTAPISTPFGGTAASIPGVIEAENFDDGGEGVAYHDTTSSNQGGQYRQTGVDIEACSDVGGGYSLGYVAPGEWLKYSVSVATTGSYTLDVRVASPGPGGRFHVEIDGVDVSGPQTVPNTGGWQIWRSVTVSGIPLTAGSHAMRVVIDANGSSGFFGNLNSLRWTLN
jgi:subtilisin family serine protease